jgi:hypothetical protein
MRSIWCETLQLDNARLVGALDLAFLVENQAR